MKIIVKVKTNSKHPKVEEISKGILAIAVKELPIDGKANRAIIKAIASYFDVATSRVTMTHGHTSKTKIIEIK